MLRKRDKEKIIESQVMCFYGFSPLVEESAFMHAGLQFSYFGNSQQNMKSLNSLLRSQSGKTETALDRQNYFTYV